MEQARIHAVMPVDGGVLRILHLIDAHGADDFAALARDIQPALFDILLNDIRRGILSPRPLPQAGCMHRGDCFFIQRADGFKIGLHSAFKRHADCTSVYMAYRWAYRPSLRISS